MKPVALEAISQTDMQPMGHTWENESHFINIDHVSLTNSSCL